ncbi:outer membrane beta-barrel protein [Helicobacter sp. T3_23-1059]
MKVQKVLLKKSVAMASMAFLLGGLSIAAPAQKAPKEAKDSSSGFFLGAELGWIASFTKETTTEQNATTTTTTSANQFSPATKIGIKLGYTHFFNKWVGIRGYASYHYGFNASDSTTNETKIPPQKLQFLILIIKSREM